jgi:hypothetical protein
VHVIGTAGQVDHGEVALGLTEWHSDSTRTIPSVR